MSATSPSTVRLAELLGGLSLASDVANTWPHGKVLRTAVLGVELATVSGGDAELGRDVLYVTLLRYLGCTGFAHEEAHEVGAGDDRRVRNVMAMVDAADPLGAVRSMVSRIGEGAPLGERARGLARLLGDPEIVSRHARAQCDTSASLAAIVGASERVTRALRTICERWDGRGAPARLSGEAIDRAMRIHQVADVVELAHARGGREEALALARRRAGGHLDPELARLVSREHARLFEAIEDARLWERFAACEPEPHALASDDRIDDVARALGHFVDLKSVHTLGHSSGVAALATAAAGALGERDDAVRTLRRAALLHDLGRLSVPTGIWDREGPLSYADRERVRMHAYYTDRVLFQAPALRPVAQLASSAHERVDGSGYHRGSASSALSRCARVLAAADAAHAMREPRPHRPARDVDAIARELSLEARRGLLDRDAVEAVIAALSGRVRAAPALPAGLSARELEVLRLVARGKTNKEIATLLGISAKTVQHHVAHVYDKIGAYSRAGAAVWVMEHGLAEE